MINLQQTQMLKQPKNWDEKSYQLPHTCDKLFTVATSSREQKSIQSLRQQWLLKRQQQISK